MPDLLHSVVFHIDENNVLHREFLCDDVVGLTDYSKTSVKQALSGNGDFNREIKDVCTNCTVEYICDL